MYMGILVSLLVSSIAIFAAAYILPGVTVDSFWTAVIVALVLGALNLLVKPFITLLTLPITLITLGLFSLVINALMILLTDYFVEGLQVENFLWALALSIVISVVSGFLNTLLSNE